MEDVRKQVPSQPDNWLYLDLSEDDRAFSKVVYLGVNAEPWAECTNAEKEQWEEEHKPEPEPEPSAE